MPAGAAHTFWNDREEEAHYIQWPRPALKMDRFFESFFGLAQDGKLNEKGLPPRFQMALMVPYFGDEIRLTSPPWPVQKFIFGILAPIDRLLGYRPEYPYSHGGTKQPTTGEEERPSATRGAMTGGIVVAVLVVIIALLVLLRRRHRGER